jgi:Domain of unknown function (DUF4263)
VASTSHVHPQLPLEAWSRYAARVEALWQETLATKPSEAKLQRFLEMHPCMVPGSRGEFGHYPSGHWPFPAAVIAQPPLQAIGSRRPDFMWIATDSGSLIPVVIEIESSQKRWLNRNGQQSADLTQALGQLASWRKWFNQAENRTVFLRYYRIPSQLASRRWAPAYVLVFGRKNERDDPVHAQLEADHRAYLRKEDEFHITFDHLRPNRNAAEMLCVINTKGEYRAITIPPTVHELKGTIAEYRSFIKIPTPALMNR